MWFLYDEEEDDSDYKEGGDGGGDSDVEDDSDKEVMRDGRTDVSNPEQPPALSLLLCLCLPFTTSLVLSIGWWLIVYKLISASRFDAAMKRKPGMPFVLGPDTGGSDNGEL